MDKNLSVGGGGELECWVRSERQTWRVHKSEQVQPITCINLNLQCFDAQDILYFNFRLIDWIEEVVGSPSSDWQ